MLEGILKRALFVVVLVGFLSACGGGNSSPSSSNPLNPPPVQAATGFTNASISGTYAFGVSGQTTSGAEAGTGVIAADGNGNIVSGEETVNLGGISCHATLTGTYSINSNGTGTGTLTSTVDAASAARGCAGQTGNGSIAIGNSGNSLIFASQTSSAVTVATAVKQ